MPELPTDQRRRLVFSAILEYTRRAVQKSPLVLLFDDLHWADEPTLQLLAYLAPHLSSMRLLVVGTYRDVELDVKRPFARTLEELLRQRLATRIPLRRLDESGVVGMLSALAGSAPPSGLAHAVFRETEGNPFFVEEVYQHLKEEGKLFGPDGEWKADLRVGTLEVPEGVRLVVGRRLDRLGEHARKILTAAAVIGRTFPLDVLQAVVDVPEDDVLNAVEEAERAQLVEIQPGRVVRYSFVHELIRTTLIGGLSLPRRQRLHLRIADALEGVRTSTDDRASVLAHHLYQAGAAADCERTARALALAGQASEVAGAFEETLEISDNMISLELSHDHPLVAAAFEHKGNALAGLRRDDEAVETFVQALDLYAKLRDDAGVARTTRMAADSFAWRNQLENHLAMINRGLRALSRDALPERARLLSRYALMASPSRLDESWERMEEAVKLAESVGDPDLLGRVLSGRALLERICYGHRASIDTARRGLELIRSDAAWDRAELLFALVIPLYYLGRFAEVDERLVSLEAAARRAGHHGALWVHERIGSNIALARTGNLRAYVSASEKALGGPHFRYATRTSLALAQLYLGMQEVALEQFAEAVREEPAEDLLTGMAEGNLCAAMAFVGYEDKARALAPEVMHHLPRLGQRNIHGSFVALEVFILTLALLGDRERCGSLYPLALLDVQSELRYVTFSLGPTSPSLIAAIAADAAGLAERAEEHFKVAAREARELPIRLLQPTVLFWHGRSLAGRREPAERERGRAMLTAAIKDFRTLEMVLHARLAEQFLRTI
jgi:tetratricopeptide (TPR) repeat protein